MDLNLRGIVAGMLALVGSGEYLPAMLPLEAQLFEAGIAAGKQPKFVQLATAAGQEGYASLSRWQELGEQQAERIGASAQFVEIFNRDDAQKPELASLISDAALIYLSGGDPAYLAQSLIGTAAFIEIERSWRSGSSLAGCSAGAMALAGQVPNPFKLTASATPGLGIAPNLKVLPHFDRYFGWIPTPMAKFLGKANPGILSVGIDENTALVSAGDPNVWSVWGFGSVQLLNGSEAKLAALAEFTIATELKKAKPDHS
jgi:cyanophycinase